MAFDWAHRRYCSLMCRNAAYAGSGNPKWRGGRMKDGHGRTLVYAPGDPHSTWGGGTHAYEYRLVAAKKIGRPLRDDEVVHHINEDHTDNRPENLEVMTRAQHMKAHDLHRKGVLARQRKARGEITQCQQ